MQLGLALQDVMTVERADGSLSDALVFAAYLIEQRARAAHQRAADAFGRGFARDWPAPRSPGGPRFWQWHRCDDLLSGVTDTTPLASWRSDVWPFIVHL
jgi:hypothetical protein